MDNPFEYNKHATGKMFLGRKKDVAALRNLMLQQTNIGKDRARPARCQRTRGRD